MGCLLGKEEQPSTPLNTIAIYSLIFNKNEYVDEERSISDSEISYKTASPD